VVKVPHGLQQSVAVKAKWGQTPFSWGLHARRKWGLTPFRPARHVRHGLIGLEEEDLLAGLEHRQPALGRVRRDAHVTRQVRVGEELSRAERRRAQEAVEVAEVADVEHLADVPLEVRRDVAARPEFAVEVGAVPEFRIATAPEKRVRLLDRRRRCDFGDGERGQREDGGAAGVVEAPG